MLTHMQKPLRYEVVFVFYTDKHKSNPKITLKTPNVNTRCLQNV